MQMRPVGTGIGTALAVGFSVALAIQGNVSAGQNPPAAGGGQGGRGGGRGFNLPPLLMETDAFPDGGIVPQKYVGPRRRAAGVQVLERAGRHRGLRHHLPRPRRGAAGRHRRRAALDGVEHSGRRPTAFPRGACRRDRCRATTSPASRATWVRARRPVRATTTTCSSSTRSTRTLDLPATASRDDLLKAMQGKTVAKAAYVGRFRQGEAPAPAK